MKLYRNPLGFGLLVAMAAILRDLPPCWCDEQNLENAAYSTNATDQNACERQLNIIYGAIQEYRNRNQSLPPQLSDLASDFLHDREILVCPFVRKTGNLKKWKDQYLRIPVFSDPSSSYAYEFCTQPFPDAPSKTPRDYKQRQMEVMGFAVPIVRCFAHRPVLNLAFDGSIYESGDTWEDIFVQSEEDKIFFHGVLGIDDSSEIVSQNEAVTKKISARDSRVGARMLDLSRHYNALLLHLSQIDHRGKLLATYPEGPQRIEGIEFDIRGLVHLAGRSFPIGFPNKIEDIPVNQKCTRIHLLHGTMFDAPPNAEIAKYRIQFSNGKTNELPIVYGKDVKTRWVDSRQKAEFENPRVAWVSPPDKVGPAGRRLRLYLTTWKNPLPEIEVRNISFLSHMTPSAPFLVAVTLE